MFKFNLIFQPTNRTIANDLAMANSNVKNLR